ncbi:hypothetical protein PHIM7_322 [Sinorhizobium phage phiM7]|uniref:Uncharacterized protein n=2 Tax=Emdodecavirus TaxID=1980937 RepID=S5MBQ4_9CAUD|nr:hypothetical protein AB690_gp192 [Sinorhizobium phage phiM12]YP_009601447.1 hypothetical protein FDH46_gp156 [Sinorhizobium phage phiM7]AGR48043.1 hypothetical protein SmphiM12_411 [Sinorhizobium phage phiM12]AKF12867.1 hypothetical protein PHIM7_322 [Sinorhizobium phage phiM7]AKF13227.1 hypothetical protein PHIM19_322 [Sinorhizobium phage phiM19]
MQFDYRELLIKYMAHVGYCEGIYFLPYPSTNGSYISEEEALELHKIAEEADIFYSQQIIS